MEKSEMFVRIAAPMVTAYALGYSLGHHHPRTALVWAGITIIAGLVAWLLPPVKRA